MDCFPKLVIAGLVGLLAASVHAGYALPADPEGFTRSGPGGGYGYATSANDEIYGRIVHQKGGLKVPVPGRPVTMPVSYRFSANAGRFAAAALFANPYVRFGVGIAAWLGAELIWDEVEKVWKRRSTEDGKISDGYIWYGGNDKKLCFRYSAIDAVKCSLEIVHSITEFRDCKIDSSSENSASGSCLYIPNNNRLQISVSKKISDCPAGWYVTPAGCIQNPPMKTITEEEFIDDLTKRPMPEKVPKELPYPTPLPVDPNPWINPEPGPNPKTRPTFVPTGDPIPNPNYDPNAEPSPENKPYIRPGIHIKPSPTPEEPWRMDLKPVNRPSDNNEPLPGPVPDPVPDGGTGNPNDKPQEQPGLCDLYPDILACVKLDKPENVDLPTKDIDFNVSPDGGWGASNAACPAPRVLTVQGRTIPIPFDLFCTWASGLRPVILALAWLSAAFIILGAKEET